VANPHVFLQKTNSQKDAFKGLKKSKKNEKKHEASFPSLKSFNQITLGNDFKTSLTVKQATNVSNRQSTEETSNYFLQTLRISCTRQGQETEENLNTIETSELNSPKIPSYHKIQRKKKVYNTSILSGTLPLKNKKLLISRNNSPRNNQSNDSFKTEAYEKDQLKITKKPSAPSSLAMETLKALINYNSPNAHMNKIKSSFIRFPNKHLSCQSSPKFFEHGDLVNANNPLLIQRESTKTNPTQIDEILSPKLFYVNSVNSKKHFNNSLSNHNSFLEVKGKINTSLNPVKQKQKMMTKSISSNISPNTSFIYQRNLVPKNGGGVENFFKR